MKTNKLITYVVIPVLLLSMQGCKKYLSEKSDKNLVVPKTVSDLQGMLDYDFVMNSRTPGFGEASADDYYATDASYGVYSELNRRMYNWTVTVYNYSNDWARSYNAVWTANYCLENIERQTRMNNDKAWDNVKGSALFYRGYYFLALCWEFAKAYDSSTSASDPGIVLRKTSDFNEASIRSSVENSYKQVLNDLKASIDYLPEKPIHPMRPSKVAGLAALARTYLSMRMYDSAFVYADKALAMQPGLLDYNSNEVLQTGNIPFVPFNREVIFYTKQSGGTNTSPSYCAIDTNLYNSYATNDLRRTVFFRDYNGVHRFKGSYSASTSFLFTGIATDELYLIRSECFARKGNVTAAMDDLNTLLERRWVAGSFVPFEANSAAEALTAILTERRKELLMRALRWIDIKRLNKEGKNIVPRRVIDNVDYELLPNDKRYALPLPDDVIKESGMVQN